LKLTKLDLHFFNLVLVMKLKNLRLAENINNFILAFNFEKFLVIFCKFPLFFFEFELIKIIKKELTVWKDAVQRIHLLMRKIIKNCLLINVVAYFLLHLYYLVHFFQMDYKYLRALFFREPIFFLCYWYFNYFVILLFSIVKAIFSMGVNKFL